MAESMSSYVYVGSKLNSDTESEEELQSQLENLELQEKKNTIKKRLRMKRKRKELRRIRISFEESLQFFLPSNEISAAGVAGTSSGKTEQCDQAEEHKNAEKAIAERSKRAGNASDRRRFEIDRRSESTVNEEVHGVDVESWASKASLKVSMIPYSEEVKAGTPKILQLPVNLQKQENPRVRKFEIREPNYIGPSNIEETVLMAVGANGVGKSTWINALANYLYGVTWDDCYRFQVIPEVSANPRESVSSDVANSISIYTFFTYREETGEPWKVTVIDLSRFGSDIASLEALEIDKKLRSIFLSEKNRLNTLNGICFVKRASEAHVTPSENHMFSKVLASFGKDVKANTFLIATFADAQAPKFSEGFKAANIPYVGVIKFNNSSLTAKNVNEENSFDDFTDSENNVELNKTLFEMTKKSFTKMFAYLKREPPIVLECPENVEAIKTRIQEDIKRLHQKVKPCVITYHEVAQEQQVVKDHEKDIEANQSFTYQLKVKKIEIEEPASGVYVTVCIKCLTTCHPVCSLSYFKDKESCFAIDDAGNCKTCKPIDKEMCSWENHISLPYVFRNGEIEKEKSSEKLISKYEKPHKGLSDTQSILCEISNRLDQCKDQVNHYIAEIRNLCTALNDITPRPNSYTDIVKQIDQLVNDEMSPARPGYKENVCRLIEARKELIEAKGLPEVFSDLEEELEQVENRLATRPNRAPTFAWDKFDH